MAGKDAATKTGKRKGSAKARKAAKAEAAALAAGLDGMSIAGKGVAGGRNEESDTPARTASGVLVSEARARDIKIQQFSLSFHSKILVEDSTIELNYGRR